MPYNFEIAMSALLSEQVVREMIVKEVEAQTGKRVTEIAAQYNKGEFTGFQIFFAPENKLHRPVSSKEFIKMTFDGE
jgi:hypothetical protein